MGQGLPYQLEGLLESNQGGVIKTVNVKWASRAEILDYVKELRKTKHIAHDDEDINNQLDWDIRQGHNLIHLDLTELVDSEDGKGCWAKNASEDFWLADFNKEFIRLTNEYRDNVDKWRNRIDCWEQVVKFEREAEKRDADYVRAMIELQDRLDRIVTHKDVPPHQRFVERMGAK